MNNNNNKKIEDILGSLDKNPRAAAPDFFYTRLIARMSAGLEPAVKRSWILRPVFALTALIAVLVINAFVILQKNNSSGTSPSDTETLQSIAAEYSLNDNNTTLFEINQDK